MKEQRKTRRRHVIQGASIFTGVGEPTIACVIMDLSPTGARIKVEGVTEIPDEIILVLSRDGYLNRHCRVVWRDSNLFGLRFITDKSIRPRPRQTSPTEPQDSAMPDGALTPSKPFEPAS